MILKSKIALIFVLGLIVLITNSFALTPLGNLSNSITILFGLLGYAIFINYYPSFPKVIRRFSVISIILFVQSVLTSYVIYGQSFMLGILANSILIMPGSALLAYFVVKRYKVDLAQIMNGICWISWILLGIYFLLYFVNFRFQATTLVKELDVSALNKTFINFGAVIYASYFFIKNRLSFLLISILLFSVNLWLDFQRNIFLIYCITLIAGVILNREKLANYKLMLSALIIIPVLVIIIPQTDFGKHAIQKTQDSLELLDDSRRRFSDPSVGIRVEEVDYAYSQIKKYPITGVGKISSQMKEKVVGNRHFFISDIGLIGVLYTYGILGIVLFIIQVNYIYRVTIKSDYAPTIYTLGLKLFTIFFVVHSISTGRSIYQSGVFIILVLLISYSEELLVKKKGTNNQIE